MLLVLDLDQRRLDARVAGEVGPDQLAVEGPLIFGIGRGMDADIATAAADPLLEQLLLRRGEHVLGGVEKHHHLMFLQFRCSEPCRIFRHLDVKTKLLAEGSERFLPRFDAAVAKTSSLAEDEDRLETGVAVGIVARTLLWRCSGGGVGDGCWLRLGRIDAGRIDSQRAGGALETGGETGRQDDGEQYFDHRDSFQRIPIRSDADRKVCSGEALSAGEVISCDSSLCNSSCGSTDLSEPATFPGRVHCWR